MKKTSSVLLVIFVLLSLYSCTGEPKYPPNDSQTPSKTTSDTTSIDEHVLPDEALAIDNLLSGSIDRTNSRTNILEGLSYICSEPSGDNGNYVDAGNMLTDGITNKAFDKTSWVGFANKGKINIDFDLGEVTDGIADIEIGCLFQLDYGIGLPGYIELYFSDDGENFVKAGCINRPTDIEGAKKYTFAFKLQNSVSARYIRLVLEKSQSVFLFIDEISAFTYDGGGENNSEYVLDYYSEYDFSNIKASYWDENDEDYLTEQNLALNKTVYISAFSSIPFEDCVPYYNTPDENVSIITDGKRSSNPSWDSNSVFKFTHGEGRLVIIDLENISSVTSVSGEFVAHTDWGVYVPSEIGTSVSENGTDWQGVGTAYIEYDEDKNTQACPFTVDLEAEYKARFVKLSFLTRGFIALSEIEVYGTKAIHDDAISPDPEVEDVTTLSDSYITPKEFLGISNILCTPVCIGDGITYDEKGMITTEEILPYVAYFEDGEPKDTFIDTFLFSPCGGFTNEVDRIRLDGWKFYVDSQFVEDRNIPALNEAVKQVGEKLGNSELEANIFLSILRPVPFNSNDSVNTFGDIDGDGKDDPLDILENRKRALKWMVDIQLQKLNETNCNRLNLIGFYWQEEYFKFDDPDEVEAFKYIRDYVHSMGYKLIWIPYYNATSRTRWKELGFDLACLQPNYAFVYSAGDDRLRSAALEAKLYGMCVEIEMNNYTNIENVKRYKQHLENGVKYGYMDAVKVYYHGIIPSEVTLAAQSEDPYTASVYKDTYEFAKGLFDKTYNQGSETPSQLNIQMNISVNEIIYKDKIEIDGGGYEINLAVSPKYGTIEINPSGQYKYIPIIGFKGEDYFIVSADYTSGEKVKIKVNITVE